MNHRMNLDHGGHAEHGHDHAGNVTEMAMSMVFTSTTTVTSYVFSLLFLFLLTLFNRFLGISKPQLGRRPSNSDHDVSEFKDRVSPLPPQVEVKHNDTDCYGAFPSAPLLGPTSQLYSDQREEKSYVTNSHPRLLGPYKRRSSERDVMSSLLEGLRALMGYALLLAFMTYNVGVLCAVFAAIVVGELFLGRFSRPSPGWQDGACHED
ncbi:copper transporter crmD [Penicillium atrosanguineum]|uniref:Copper transport protein n=1 Tax=Penicillium atrosanguineum TaxID=1132637 RepID=A0A9W9U173_9EURO|nr:copper transporter crmD [Penicillium atrosanguineum]